MTRRDFDTIVIGGGPAGSSASTTLAMKGRKVLLLEKEKFPRYHIGESLIPYTYYTLERLGMIEKMKASHFPKKYSVQFVNRNGRLSAPFYFFQQLETEASQTWQVVRGEFDQMLLNNAREKGVDVREEVAVTETIQENGQTIGVRTITKSGEKQEFYAPMTIDASGRDAMTMKRNNWQRRDPVLNKIAIWTYWKGAIRDPGIDEGATTVAYVPDKGWFWYIPLPDDILSVGVVAEKDYLYSDGVDLEKIYHREVAKNVWIQKHIAPATVAAPYRVTAEYSYRSEYCSSDGIVLAGDAFQFLDPVFSSGVFLALRGGEMAAEAVDAALTAGDYSAERFGEYGAKLCAGVESMRKLVYTFYDHDYSFRSFLNKYPDFKGDMTDCLMGNLFRDFDPLFKAVSEFANIPAPLKEGYPLVAVS